ncbi:MAG: hypothetical protein OXP71_05335 [Candidatus Poribacteria bacterium]|nr:hypothetical protein [Candidatus Poribacteria bacterium]
MQFTYYLPGWAVAIALAIVAGVTIYAYLRLQQSLNQGLRFILIGLRVAAASLVLLCLLAPVVSERIDVTPKTNFLILADTSQSMNFDDVELDGRQTDRLTLVNQLLFNLSSQFLDVLANQFEVHLYQFNTHAQRIADPLEPLEAKGRLTDIATSIQQVLKKWRGQRIAGVMLITDGAHNSSAFQSDSIADVQVPIYTVGVGNPQPRKDLKISRVKVSPVVYVGHDAPIRFTVEQTGYAGSTVRVSLMQDARLADAALITLDERPTQDIEFTLDPQKEGVFQYVISVPTLPDELTHVNNEKVFSLKVVKTKFRVLYVDGRPRWEYTFLKRVLERDANIESTCMIISNRTNRQLRGTLLGRTNRHYPQTTALGRLPYFPDAISGLLKYDVLIIGDLPSTTLNKLQHDAIVDFVENHGKSVIFLGGRSSLGAKGLKETALERLLPIVIPAKGCAVQNEDFSLEPTQQGIYHPIMRVGDTRSKVEAIWRDLPTLPRWFGDFRLRGGATTLAVRGQSRDENSMPIVVIQRSGLGKSLLIAAEGLWHWGFGVWGFKEEDDTYPRFWGGAIRWMASQPYGKPINLTTDLTTYLVGDEVQITVYAYDESYRPLADAAFKINVIPPGGNSFQVSDATSSQIAGVYTTQFEVNQKGNYQIRAMGVEDFSSLGEDSTEILVQSPLSEFENPQLNEPLLQQLAENTGGFYTPIRDVESLPNKIKDVEERVFTDQERDLWNTPIILILVVGLLGAEWFLRKRSGLV